MKIVCYLLYFNIMSNSRLTILVGKNKLQSHYPFEWLDVTHLDWFMLSFIIWLLYLWFTAWMNIELTSERFCEWHPRRHPWWLSVLEPLYIVYYFSCVTYSIDDISVYDLHWKVVRFIHWTYKSKKQQVNFQVPYLFHWASSHILLLFWQ